MKTGITILVKLGDAEKLNFFSTFLQQPNPTRRGKRKRWLSENLKTVIVDFVVIWVLYLSGQFLEMP